MSDVWPQVVLVGVLVLVNAVFAGSELALVSLREGQLQRLEQRSAKGAVLARLARDPSRFFATIQIGITLTGFLASAATLTRPAVWLLSRSTDVVVRLLGGDPSRQREEVTPQELRDLVAVQRSFSPQQRLIIDGAFEISQRTLLEVVRPRPDVFVLDAAQPSAFALQELVDSGHSRAPVAEQGNLDAVVGVVHMCDLLGGRDRPVRELASELCVFPDGLGVLDALHGMQTQRVQFAVVVDEHGGAVGIVTMEDLVEEIVGEIYDESDRDVVAVRPGSDGSLMLSGRFPIHDLPHIGVYEIPDGQYTTVAGLLLDQLGRIPERPGDQVEIAGRTFEVTEMKAHAITGVRISAIAPNLTDRARPAPKGDGCE